MVTHTRLHRTAALGVYVFAALACGNRAKDDTASSASSLSPSAINAVATEDASASADFSENERVTCTPAACEVGTLTPRALAALQAHAAVSRLTLRPGATQEDLNSLSQTNLPNLVYVYVSKAPSIRDVTPLARLAGLRTIEILDTGVTSLAPLAALPALQTLMFGTNANRSDPWPVIKGSAGGGQAPPAIPSLETPGSATEVDISAVASMKSLRTLDLRGVTVRSLEPLRGLALNNLALRQMHVDDTSPLESLGDLTDLGLFATSVPSFAWIGKRTKLKGLSLTNVRLKNLDMVETLPDLWSLQAWQNPDLKSLAPLAKLTKLKMLQIAGTQVEDLAPLANLSKLDTLDVSGTRVKTLAPLGKLTALTMVQATDTSVQDLAPLHASTRLTYVTVPKTCPEAEIDALKKVAPKAQVARR
jgi:hypothetical protein